MAGTILIVEDDLLVRMGIEMILGRQGYTVSSCDTGEMALELVATKPPSLVLMDVNLAGKMDGVEAARQIMSDRALPIIFLTAQGDALTRQRMLAVSPHGILSKPFTPGQLTDIVNGAATRGSLE